MKLPCVKYSEDPDAVVGSWALPEGSIVQQGEGLARASAAGQLNKVEKFFKEAGYLCVFLPKYHPELNAIERYWGHIKYLLRLHCEYSLPHMLQILPGTMRDVPVEFTRAWSRYLKSRDLTQWTKHREATARGDQVVEARGGGKTIEEKKAAEEKALAAAQECRTFSTSRAKGVFKEWKERRAMEQAPKEKGAAEREKEA
ncbi:unnamed protein product [Ectocarpus sp. CCAP 1310/34]|nr:unnamed protein product [Ectocarpus sp. CCAP 1310/34]